MYYRGNHIITLENGLERRKKMFYAMNLKDRVLYVNLKKYLSFVGKTVVNRVFTEEEM